MNDEFEKYLVFAGSYGTFNYYLNCLKATEDRNKYKYISNPSSLKGFKCFEPRIPPCLSWRMNWFLSPKRKIQKF